MIKNILRKSSYSSMIIETYFLCRNYLKPNGWLKSTFRKKSIDGVNNPIPWFTYSSINFIQLKLSTGSFRVFEFGSGNSTIWFADKVESIFSVENDELFYRTMKPQLNKFRNVTYELRNLKFNYYQKIIEFNNEFDIVVIDGRERNKCTINCLKALKDNGVIIFDNSDRIDYQESYDFLTVNGFKRIDFKGLGPINSSEWQTTIFYRKENCFNI